MIDPELLGDVSINAIRYPIYRDPKNKGELGWKRIGGANQQEGSAEQEAVEAWNFGWPAGMGETQRVASESAGYPFSQGIDCTSYGFARLPPAFWSATPTNAPADKPTFGWEDSPPGAATFNVATFTKSITAGTTSQTVAHGLAVAPKAMIFWSAGKTVSGTVSAGYRAFFGFTDGTTQRGNAWRSPDNVTTPGATGHAYYNAGLVIMTGGVGSTAIQGSVLSANWDTTNFQINWTSNDTTADIIHFIAIGGGEVSAKVVGWTTPASTGNQSVTGIGFKPDMVMFNLQHDLAAPGVGAIAEFAVGLGTMDNNGNQWALGASDDWFSSNTRTRRVQSTSQCVRMCYANTTTLMAGSFVSMDSDGWTVNWTTNALGAGFVEAALCLKGIRAKAGTWNKATGVAPAADAVTGVGFQPGLVMLASFQNITASGNQNHARMGIGAGSGAATVEAGAFSATTALATSSTDGLDDTALIFGKINNDTQTKDATATLTSLDSGGFTLSWTVNDAVATEMLYLALAASGTALTTRLYYIANGQRVYKMSLSGTTITVENEKDFGGGAQCGRPEKFGTTAAAAKTYLPLGNGVNAQTLDTIAASGADTWSALGTTKSLAFCKSNDGNTIKLWRGHTNNKLQASSDGSTWTASSFDVGDASTDITNIQDTGPMLVIAKTDNLYMADQTGAINKITHEPVGSTNVDTGAGLLGVEGTERAFYNHKRGLFYFDGTGAYCTGPDEGQIAESRIPNISGEPFRGMHLETAIAGNWVYSMYRVVQGATTYSYLLSGYRKPGAERIKWDTVDYWTGIGRIAFVDSSNRLWAARAGTVGFWQLGATGSPDSGNDTLGYGAASSTYTLFLPETDFGAPYTLKQLREIDIELEDVGATRTVTIQVYRDGGTVETVGTAISSGTVSKRYWTLNTNDTCYRCRIAIVVTTNGAYSPSSSVDLKIRRLAIRATLRPDRASVWQVIIDTSCEYSNGAEPEDTPQTMQSNLKALENGAPVAYRWPDDNTGNVKITEVSDLEMMETDQGLTQVIRVTAKEWINS